MLISTLVSLWQVSRSLTARELTTSTAEFALPEPVYSAKLGVSGLRMRFDRPVHRLAFDARSLDLPYTMPDPVALKLAREQCQQELDSLGLNAGLPARVRGLLSKPGGGFRGLEEVAAALKRSPRTLKRQLSAQGVTLLAAARARAVASARWCSSAPPTCLWRRSRCDSATRT